MIIQLKWKKFFLLIACLLVEFIFLKFSNLSEWIWIATIVLLVLLIALFVVIKVTKKKVFDLELSLIKTLQTKTASIAGLMAAVYMLLHIAWIGDMLFNYKVNLSGFSSVSHFFECQCAGFIHNWNNGTSIILSLTIFLLPFLIFPFLKKGDTHKLVDKNERKVLVTAVSKLSLYNDENHKLTSLENKYWHNWETFHKVLKTYPNIKTIILIFSKESMTEYQRLSLGEFETEWNNHLPNKLSAFIILEKLIRKQFSTVTSILKTDKLINFNDFNSFHKDLHDEIESMLKGYENHQILFNISGGTAILSSSLTLLALKGKRGIIYTTQKGENIINEAQVDARTIEDLLEELQEAIEE